MLSSETCTNVSHDPYLLLPQWLVIKFHCLSSAQQFSEALLFCEFFAHTEYERIRMSMSFAAHIFKRMNMAFKSECKQHQHTSHTHTHTSPHFVSRTSCDTVAFSMKALCMGAAGHYYSSGKLRLGRRLIKVCR